MHLGHYIMIGLYGFFLLVLYLSGRRLNATWNNFWIPGLTIWFADAILMQYKFSLMISGMEGTSMTIMLCVWVIGWVMYGFIE